MKKILVTLALALVLVLGCVALASADGVPSDGTVVGSGEIDKITTIAGHPVHLDETKVMEGWSTCTKMGIAWFVCDEPTHLNGMHFVYVEKAPHQWVEDGYLAPNCTEAGYSKRVCRVCGAVDEKYWDINPNGHTYSGKAYKVVFGATCTSVGYGVVACDVCGNPIENTAMLNKMQMAAEKYEWDADAGLYKGTTHKNWVMLQKIAHNYTDWKYVREATCYEGGLATRTCIWCGDIQYVDADTTLYVDSQGNVLTAEIAKTFKDPVDPKHYPKLLTVETGKIDKVNVGYNVARAALKGQTFESRIALEKEVNKYTKPVPPSEVEICHLSLVSDEEYDCTTRRLVFECPYCHGDTIYYMGGYTESPHPDFVVYVLEPSHIYAGAQPAAKLWEADGKIWDSQVPGMGPNKNVEYAQKLALAADASVLPTCELPGINLYKCLKYDAAETKDFHSNDPKKPEGYKFEVVPAKGHTWEGWETAETYKKDGVPYAVQVRKCAVCGKNEHRTVAVGGDVEPLPGDVPPTLLEQFVERCYGQALRRTSDPEGFKYWVNKLTTKEQTAQEVAYGFVFSPEMNADRKITEDPDSLLKSLYALYLGREPDGDGLAYWKQRIADGITMEELNYGFAQSVEFQGIVASFGLE